MSKASELIERVLEVDTLPDAKPAQIAIFVDCAPKLARMLRVALTKLERHSDFSVRNRCPKCNTEKAPDWIERSPSGDAQCSECKGIFANWKWVEKTYKQNTALTEIERIASEVEK